MTQEEFCKLISDMEEKITKAIITTAQWEVWFQVELMINIRSIIKSGAKELKQGDMKWVDIGFGHNAEQFYIGLNVESANEVSKFSGKNLKVAVDLGGHKLKDLSAENRWVCCVAWSLSGKKALREFGFDYVSESDLIAIGIKTIG